MCCLQKSSSSRAHVTFRTLLTPPLASSALSTPTSSSLLFASTRTTTCISARRTFVRPFCRTVSAHIYDPSLLPKGSCPSRLGIVRSLRLGMLEIQTGMGSSLANAMPSLVSSCIRTARMCLPRWLLFLRMVVVLECQY